jgi:CheY-like chemotaxis protein
VAPTRKRVLLADDDTDTSLVLKDRLESFGYEVTVVSNGREALEEINCERYGAVVMDVKMPELDGLQALGLLKRLNPMTPVIMITSIEENVAVAMAEGAQVCLLKPVNADRLRAELDRCFVAAS